LIDQYSYLPSRVSFSLEDISKGLNGLFKSHSKGPDGIAAVLFFQCREALSTPLLLLFNKSLQQGIFPAILKTSRATQIFKLGEPTDF